MNSNTTTVILKAACCVAGIDGEICDREHPLLAKMASAAGVGSDWMAANLDLALNDRLYYQRQLEQLRTDAEQSIRTLLGVALIDGYISAPESIILQHFAQKIGIERECFQRLLRELER